MTMEFFGGTLRGGALMLLGCLVGCGSAYPIKTYEGEFISEAEVGVLKAPEDLDVVAIDGKEMKGFLLENLALDYHLLPGEHRVVFKYSGLWANPRNRKEDGGAGVDVIDSKLHQVSIDAQAGKVYTFDYLVPNTRTQAVEIAKVFEARIAEDGVIVAASQAYIHDESKVFESASATPTHVPAPPVVGSVEVSTGGASTSDSDLPRLDAMKAIWASSTKDEKKAFMSWAIE